MIYLNKQKFIKIIFAVILLSILSGCGQTENNNLEITDTSEITSENTGNVSSDNSEGNVSTAPLNQHTVTFKDYDGTVLKTEYVYDGNSATPPINASKEGYKIVKWDKQFDDVKEDIIVTPVYEKISGSTISIDNVTAKSGETVQVSVKLQNNPGINGATIKVTFDSNLVLKKVKNGEALKELNFTKPGELSSPCSFLWDGMDKNITEDGEMLFLTFKISDNVKSGEKLGVSISYTDGAIYDKDLQNVDFNVVGGAITIE